MNVKEALYNCNIECCPIFDVWSCSLGLLTLAASVSQLWQCAWVLFWPCCSSHSARGVFDIQENTRALSGHLKLSVTHGENVAQLCPTHIPGFGWTCIPNLSLSHEHAVYGCRVYPFSDTPNQIFVAYMSLYVSICLYDSISVYYIYIIFH